MLSLVAGPLTIDNMDAFEAGLTFNPPTFRSFRGTWVERLGFLCVADSGVYTDQLWLIQMDGSAVRLGYRATTDSIAITPDSIILGYGGLWSRVQLPSTAPLETAHTGGPFADQYAVLPDRLIAFNTLEASIVTAPLTGGAGTLEYTFAGMMPVGTLGVLAFAGPLHGVLRFWAMVPDTGALFLYNATSKVEITNKRSSFGSAFRLAGYSVKHDLFFVIRRGVVLGVPADQLYVYSSEPQAATLSAPILIPGARRGGLSQASSTLLGSDGEAVPNRGITFSTGDIVNTDQNGVATVTYHASTGPVGGPIVVTATLVE